MDDGSDERWLNLCRLAENEHDPVILLELVTEINRLLGEKEARLHPKIESANLTPGRIAARTACKNNKEERPCI